LLPDLEERIEVQVEHGDLKGETNKARDVKCVILGDIPDMGKAIFVRMRRGVKEVELEEGVKDGETDH